MVAPASQTIKPPPLGTSLAERYRLLRFLGSGAIGAVYEAATPSDDRVAVKVLLELDQSRLAKELATRFLREAQVASTLDSKHVVSVIDSGVDAALSIPYLVMPLLSGFDLEQLLQRAGALHPTVAARIIAQACAGLMEAHRKEIIHRDIKPGNIYLDHEPNGQVTARVLDFGMAKLMATDETITRAGAILGTPHYMSPEQSINAKDVDGRADVWGIAATFYHALTGVPPFNDERTFADLHLALNTKGPPHIQDRAPWIDPGLARVVHGALLRDRDLRCSSVSELRTALLPFLAGSTEISEVMLEPCPAILRRTTAARADRTDVWERSAPSGELPPMSDDPVDKLLGKRLGGGYRLLRRLGRGGFGGLYEALGPDANRYAVRALDPKLGGSEPAAGRRFVREARALAAIDDPHVVRLVDAAFDEELQQPFVVVELLYGLDMQAVIDKHGAMHPRDAIRLFIDACRGLEACHGHGVVHRDVRPANLFLVEEPSGDVTVKLTGFGLVKQLVGEEAAHTLTRGGEILGSLMHMSPEQAKNAKVADFRSDVWSVGASLFHCLAGEPPWPKELSGSDLLIAIGTGVPARVDDKAPWVTRDLAEVVHKALAVKPEERFANVAELREALETLSDKPAVKLRDLGPLPESMREKARKRAAAARAADAPLPEKPPEPRPPLPSVEEAMPPTQQPLTRQGSASRASWLLALAIGVLTVAALLGFIMLR
jgi:serine/threonine protein kinase